MTQRLTSRGLGIQNRAHDVRVEGRERSIQFMVPESVRRQVALMGAERGESIRTLVLRGLKAVGIQISDSELADRRGRRRNGRGHGNGAK
jgi:hypothetical protein